MYETQSGRKVNEYPISWIRELPELNENRAPGNTCLWALSSGRCGTIDEPINDSKGCGTVMRVAPIGLYIKDPKNAGIIAVESSAITHGHQLAMIPSFVLACMINYILNQKLNVLDSLNESLKELNDYNIFSKDNMDYFTSLINKAIELSKSNINDIDAINQLGKGWVAEEALAIALYSCLKYEDSFENAVVCSINHDGDSDSTGSIAGNIIGAVLGLNSIPNYYVDNLELKDTILEISHDLSIDVPIGEYSPNKDENWENKYLYCRKQNI